MKHVAYSGKRNAKVIPIKRTSRNMLLHNHSLLHNANISSTSGTESVAMISTNSVPYLIEAAPKEQTANHIRLLRLKYCVSSTKVQIRFHYKPLLYFIS